METCGALFWCVREGVSREQLAGSRLDKNDLPSTKADGSIGQGPERRKAEDVHACLFPICGLGPLTFGLCY